MTQKQLAASICADENTVSRWITGKNIPDNHNLEKLYEEFKVDFRNILYPNNKEDIENEKAMQEAIANELKPYILEENIGDILAIILSVQVGVVIAIIPLMYGQYIQFNLSMHVTSVCMELVCAISIWLRIKRIKNRYYGY